MSELSYFKQTLSKYDYLLDPENCNHDLFDNSYTQEELLDLLESILLIRLCEKKLAYERKSGVIGGPVHLGAGQEAIAVGISKHLTKADKVFSAHRSHPHILALKGSPYKLFAEVLGKNTGFSKGMGGSMHLIDQDIGFFGSVPIVAGTVPLAVGAGLSSKVLGLNTIGVSYLGDGAIEEGVVAESLNLSSALKIPVLFVVENNLFSSHMHISQRQPIPFTARFAIANNIPYRIVDGNNIFEVMNASKELISYARENSHPVFIEAITFRHYGHVDWREDIDVGVNRSTKDLEAWMRRDPLIRLKQGIISNTSYTENDFLKLHDRIEVSLKNYWNKALQDPYPNDEELLARVFSE